MLESEKALRILSDAEEICSAVKVSAAVKRVAEEISVSLSGEYPLVLGVMGGAVVFTGQLLTQLLFPLEFDYIHVSRYGANTHGGEINWRVGPRQNAANSIGSREQYWVRSQYCSVRMCYVILRLSFFWSDIWHEPKRYWEQERV